MVSILLAFGIEAGWAERQERRKEMDALERLEAEFAEVESVMRRWQGHHQRVFDAGEALLSHTGPHAIAPIAPDSIGTLIGIIEFTWTLDPPEGVLSSLLASGQLSLLRNQELRAALASWQSYLEDLHGDEAFAVQVVNERLSPYLDGHISYRSLVSLRADYPRTPSQFPDDFAALLSDRVFENLLEARISSTHWALASYGEALDGLARLRSLLQAELDR